MIESRIREISEDLDALRIQKSREVQPSPGLLENIARLERKLSNFRESLDLWRTVLRVYPNYDR